MAVLLQLHEDSVKCFQALFVQPETDKMGETPFFFIGIFKGASYIFLNLIDVNYGRVKCGDEVQRRDRVRIALIEQLNLGDETANADIGLNICLLTDSTAEILGKFGRGSYFRFFLLISR